MIIGRTDENDIVVNHRSISRNHAKVTRDPETGRYTISDLQSSNGVRVNGQDYGKVELRRGDTVDLGHVRLRFVEPGEDFVFARDAVIADVPDAGGKKGLLVAIVLGVLVLGGVGAFFAMRGGDDDKTAGKNGSDTNGSTNNGKGSDNVVATNNGSDEVGSGGVTQNPEVVPIDAVVEQMVKPPTEDVAGTIKVECQQAQLDRKWADMTSCADRLGQYDAPASKKLKAKAKEELENELAKGRIDDAAKEMSLTKAKKELGTIEDGSVYRPEAAEGRRRPPGQGRRAVPRRGERPQAQEPVRRDRQARR